MGAEYPLVRQIKANGAIEDKLGSGKLGQSAQINMAGIKVIETGNVSRQHAGVGGMGGVRDQGQPDSRDGFHPPPP